MKHLHDNLIDKGEQEQPHERGPRDAPERDSDGYRLHGDERRPEIAGEAHGPVGSVGPPTARVRSESTSSSRRSSSRAEMGSRGERIERTISHASRTRPLETTEGGGAGTLPVDIPAMVHERDTPANVAKSRQTLLPLRLSQHRGPARRYYLRAPCTIVAHKPIVCHVVALRIAEETS